MCPACVRGFMTAGPDVVRGPNHFHGPDTHDPKRVFPIDRSTASHHVIITLDRNKLGRFFGEQLGDPGMLVRMTTGADAG
jgi:hypothetical protein